MTGALVSIIIAVAVLLIAWFIVERFSPDPLVSKIAKVIIFLVALYLILTKLLPIVGASF